MSDTTVPAWISAAVRYLVTLGAAYVGIENPDTVTQIVAIVIGAGTIAFGLYRTNKLAKSPPVA